MGYKTEFNNARRALSLVVYTLSESQELHRDIFLKLKKVFDASDDNRPVDLQRNLKEAFPVSHTFPLRLLHSHCLCTMRVRDAKNPEAYDEVTTQKHYEIKQNGRKALERLDVAVSYERAPLTPTS